MHGGTYVPTFVVSLVALLLFLFVVIDDVFVRFCCSFWHCCERLQRRGGSGLVPGMHAQRQASWQAGRQTDMHGWRGNKFPNNVLCHPSKNTANIRNDLIGNAKVESKCHSCDSFKMKTKFASCDAIMDKLTNISQINH